jgi:hypothetical protein
MSDRSAIYDLGDIDVALDRTRMATAPARPVRGVRGDAASAADSRGPARGIDVAGLLSLIVPGLGQLACGRTAAGLLFLSWFGLLGALGWALTARLDSVMATLRLFGYPGTFVAWTLGALYVAGCLFHCASVLTAGPSARRRAAHPVVTGIASGLLPGAGQVLAGSRTRAVLFVSALWTVAALWLVEASAVEVRLDALGVAVPDAVRMLTQPIVRWTVPAVIWALAVYDAVSSASSSRRA